MVLSAAAAACDSMSIIGRKASRKSGSSDEKSLTKWMKQLMAAQSQLGKLLQLCLVASYARLTDPSSLSCRIIC